MGIAFGVGVGVSARGMGVAIVDSERETERGSRKRGGEGSKVFRVLRGNVTEGDGVDEGGSSGVGEENAFGGGVSEGSVAFAFIPVHCGTTRGIGEPSFRAGCELPNSVEGGAM